MLSQVVCKEELALLHTYMQKIWSNYFNAFHATVTGEIVWNQRQEKQLHFWTGAEPFTAEWAEAASKMRNS